jgi:hypothetical protein
MPGSEEPIPKLRPRTGLVVSWQVLAVVLALVTVASLTSLSIVATLKNVDALSTVALALAVLAFGAQLVDSVVQGQASTQQMLQSERLNAETRSLLSEVRVTSQEIRATQSGLVDRLMGHVLQAIPEAVEEVAATQADGDPAALGQALVQDLSHRLQEEVGRAFTAPLPHGPGSGVTSDDQRAINLLTSFPDEADGQRSLAVLAELSPAAKAALRDWGRFELSRRRAGLAFGRRVDLEEDPSPGELLQHGLLERVDGAVALEGDEQHLILSELGRGVARLLLARGERPDWLRDEGSPRAEPLATTPSAAAAEGPPPDTDAGPR